MPVVSVIIPVYNAEKYLRECLDSVINQTFKDIEIICVDDGSTDNSVNILNEYAERDNRVIVLKQNNSGPSKARNLGWDLAKGIYIAFLDSDDVWHRRKLEIQHNFMIDNKEISLTCHQKEIIKPSDLVIFNNKNIELQNINVMNPIRLLFKHYSNGATSSFMLKNIDDVRFNIRKKHSEDYLLILQVLFKNKGVCLDCVLSASFKETYGDDGLSKNLWKMEQGDLDTFKVLKEEKYISSILHFLVAVFSLIKYFRRYLICMMRR